MTQFRVEISHVARSKGQSSVRNVSYQSGSKLTDQRLDQVHDFRNKSGVFEHGLILPNGLTCEPEIFWNQVELHHKRRNSVTARELKMNLPKQLPPGVKRVLVRSISQTISDRYGVGVGFAIHEPRYFTACEIENNPYQYWELDDQGRMTNGNWHAHLTASACHVSYVNNEIRLGRKCVALDPIHCQRARLPNFAVIQRSDICKRINTALKISKISLEVDHRSYLEQGRLDIPGIHLGPVVCSIERKLGVASEVRKKDELRKAQLRHLRNLEEISAREEFELRSERLLQLDDLYSELEELEDLIDHTDSVRPVERFR